MCRAFDYQNKIEIGQRYISLSDITPTSMSCSGRSRALLAQGVGDFLDIPRGGDAQQNFWSILVKIYNVSPSYNINTHEL